MSKNLIVYFSRKGENYVAGNIVDLPQGNCEVLAKMIHELIDSTLFQVKTVHSYPQDYHQCTAQAKKELLNQERPKILDYVHQFNQYDHIILCYPNWWSTMPMAMFTFLQTHDTTGKHIYPLCSHEGSGMGVSENDIKKLCPQAIVHQGLAIRGSQVHDSLQEVKGWLGANHL